MSLILPSKQYSHSLNQLKKALCDRKLTFNNLNTLQTINNFFNPYIAISQFYFKDDIYLSYVFQANNSISFGFFFTKKQDKFERDLYVTNVIPFVFNSIKNNDNKYFLFLKTEDFSTRLKYLSRKLIVDSHLDPLTTFQHVFSCDVKELSDLKEINKIVLSKNDSLIKQLKDEEYMIASSITNLTDIIKNNEFQVEQFKSEQEEFIKIQNLTEQIKKLQELKYTLSEKLNKKVSDKNKELNSDLYKRQKNQLDSKLKEIKLKRKSISKS